MKKVLKSQRGFSLVELIVVIAIMALLTTAGIIGVGMISGKPAQECAKKMEGMLEKNRTTCMGKVSAYIEIYQKNGAWYARETVDSGIEKETRDPVRLCNSGVSIVDSKHGVEITNCKVEFKRSDGSLKCYSINDGAAVYDSDNFSFEIKKASKTYVVEIERVTGRITMKKL